MFDRVIVNVIDVLLQIPLIADQMLPEPSLPHTSLSLAAFTRTAPCLHRHGTENVALMRCPRMEKSRSSTGYRQSACRWSGHTQMAMVSRGSAILVFW